MDAAPEVVRSMSDLFETSGTEKNKHSNKLEINK